MSLADSVKHRKAVDQPIPEFWWWKFEDIEPFLKAALEAGAEVRAYPGRDAQGHWDLHFKIVSPSLKAGDGEYNISHPCPPFCPGT